MRLSDGLTLYSMKIQISRGYDSVTSMLILILS